MERNEEKSSFSNDFDFTSCNMHKITSALSFTVIYLTIKNEK